ncbi:MAG: DUF4139 domain-containing protein [Alphaproteobacteria bacterium]|nr:DUF4139 domain-containing protein [Alphaproteobacteria bacterium]
MRSNSWFSKLFQGSDEEAAWRRRDERLSDALGYPGASLRLHRAGGNLATEPRLVWQTRGERPGGLMEHITATREVLFSDVLLILSQADFLRATATGGVPWLARLQKILDESYEGLSRRETWLPANRRLNVRMVRDGSGDLGQLKFGLEPGEFITGLLPQLYTGRTSRSQEALVVHLNLPGVTQGYQRVGRLYDDQAAFTLGSHFLDSYSQPELREPCLYRVLRREDGAFEHQLRADLEGDYQLEANQEAGVSVLTITHKGAPLAHIVLEVVSEAPSQRDFEAEARQRVRLSFDLAGALETLARTSAQQAEGEGARHPNSQIDMVTLFSDRAIVTRSRFVKLEEGAAEVRFEGLLPWLEGKHFQAEVRRGKARVRRVEALSGAQVEARERAVTWREAKVLVDAIEEAIRRLADLMRQKAVLGRTLLSGDDGELDVSTVTAVHNRVEYIHRTQRDLDAAIDREVERAAAMDDQLAPLLRSLERPAPAGQTAVVHLSCKKSGSVEIALSYPIQEARWAPRYRARLLPTSGMVEIECHAVITQSSGEEWQDVELRLSSTLDTQRAEPPPLNRWSIGDAAELAEVLAQKPEGSLTVVLDSDQDTDEQGLIEIPDRCTVTNEGEQRVLITVQTAPIEPQHIAIPRLDPRVYRLARVAEWDGPALPEGPVSCYVGDAYVGAARLSALAPGQPLSVGMGVRKGIRVQRALVTRERLADHPQPGRVSHSFHYRTSVFSDLASPIALELIEQFPTAAGPEAEVVLQLATSNRGQVAEIDDAEHTLRWSLSLEGKDMAMVDTRFLITVGAD